MKSNAVHVGKLVYQYRKNLKMSQKQVAVKLGVNTGQYVYNIEKGSCGFPPKKLAKLSLVLHIPLELLKNAMLEDYKTNLEHQIMKSL